VPFGEIQQPPRRRTGDAGARAFEQDVNTQALSFEEKLSLMVDRLWTRRQNLALERWLRYAKLRGNALFADDPVGTNGRRTHRKW
jgi:hypothetical protein